jgi:hypothetical protein
MQIGVADMRASIDRDNLTKAIPVLLALMTVAAGAILILAFQKWVDFGITKVNGTDAEAATGISDGWIVAGFAVAILGLIGGVLFRPALAPILLPLIALAAVCIFGIAGFDTVTNWTASGVEPDNPGILVQAEGEPTAVPYLISALAIVVAVSAAVIRGIRMWEAQGAGSEGAIPE